MEIAAQKSPEKREVLGARRGEKLISSHTAFKCWRETQTLKAIYWLLYKY